MGGIPRRICFLVSWLTYQRFLVSLQPVAMILVGFSSSQDLFIITKKKISETGDKAWAGSTILDLIPLTVNLFHNYQTAARIKKSQKGEEVKGEDLTSKELESLYMERWMLLVNEAKLLSDLPIAMTYGWNLKTDPGVIALCGMVSSICGLHKIWVKVRKV